MKNITVAIDDALYRAARIAAAERGASVSALVRDYLRTLTTSQDTHAQATNALFEAMDKADGLCAADRLSRDAAHAR